jgi:hypothetical protein
MKYISVSGGGGGGGVVHNPYLQMKAELNYAGQRDRVKRL